MVANAVRVGCLLFVSSAVLTSSSDHHSNPGRLIHHNEPLHGGGSCWLLDEHPHWFLGRINFGGLCNSLFAVFSQVPIALLLKTSLVVSDMYSRKSFEDNWGDMQTNHIQLPFSAFFDLPYFSSYWRAHGNLTVIERQQVSGCYRRSEITIIHEDPFHWNYHPLQCTFFNAISCLIERWKQRDRCQEMFDCSVLEDLRYSNLSVPLPAHARLVQLASDIRFHNYYTFWQDDQHARLLQKVYASLRPARPISERIESILASLGSSFIAVHLRLEGDVVPFDAPWDTRFMSLLSAQLEFIRSSSCYCDSSAASRPTLYIASGLFSNSNNTNSFLSKRAQRILTDLSSLGFTRIVTGHDFEGTRKPLYLEQHALLDLYVARRAKCFIPCYMANKEHASSFSYFVERYRQLDTTKILTMQHRRQIEKEYPQGIGFSAWGV